MKKQIASDQQEAIEKQKIEAACQAVKEELVKTKTLELYESLKVFEGYKISDGKETLGVLCHPTWIEIKVVTAALSAMRSMAFPKLMNVGFTGDKYQIDVYNRDRPNSNPKEIQFDNIEEFELAIAKQIGSML